MDNISVASISGFDSLFLILFLLITGSVVFSVFLRKKRKLRLIPLAIFLISFLYSIVVIISIFNSTSEMKEYDIEITRNCAILDSINASGNVWKREWLYTDHYPFLFFGALLDDTVYISHSLHEYPPPPAILWSGIDILNDSLPTNVFDSLEYQKELRTYEEEISKHPLESFRYEYGNHHHFGSIYNDSVSVVVNTNYTISKFSSRTIEIYEAYPIVITNISSDTLITGTNPYIVIVVEAKDSLNNWSKITDYYHHGVPISSYYALPPSYTVIVSMFKTTGDYHTQLRVKVGNNYSNEWTGNIDYNQFTSMFDENGEYKKEYLDFKHCTR